MRTTNLILLAIIVVMGIMYARSCDNADRREDAYLGQIDALSDHVTTTRNSLGQAITEIKGIELVSRGQLEHIQNLEGANRRLRQTVKEQKNAIAVITASSRTEIVYRTDSITVTRDANNNPIYFKSFADKWKWGSVSMSQDSLSLFIKVKNEFDFSIKERKRLFKPTTYEVYARSLNPDTYVDDLAGAVVTVREKKWHVGPFIGYGFGMMGKSSTFVGAGVSYGIVSF